MVTHSQADELSFQEGDTLYVLEKVTVMKCEKSDIFILLIHNCLLVVVLLHVIVVDFVCCGECQ